MTSTKEELALAASRALEIISSSAHARSQCGTPLDAEKVAQKPSSEPIRDACGNILDLFMSPDKPKSRLRRMAEKSARRYSRISFPVDVDHSQPDLILDLGTPSKSPLDAPLPNFKPRPRWITNPSNPRRSSLASRKSSSPLKSSRKSIEEMFDNLDLAKATPRKAPDHSRSARPSKSHFAVPSSCEKALKVMVPPLSLRSSTRVTIVHGTMNPHDSPTKEEKKELSMGQNAEVCESQECEPQYDQVESAEDSTHDDDSESDAFSLSELIPTQKEDKDKVDENEPIASPRFKYTRASRLRLVIQDSDSAPETPQKLADEHTVSSVVSHNRMGYSRYLANDATERVDSDSDGSVEISPSRAARIRETRAKLLSASDAPRKPATLDKDISQPCGRSLHPDLPNISPDDVRVHSAHLSTRKPSLSHEEGSSKFFTAKVIDLTSSPDTPALGPKAPSAPTCQRGHHPTQRKHTTAVTQSGVKKKEAPFARRREALAEALVEALDQKVFNRQLPTPLELIWSKRLNTTAGRAKWTIFRDASGQMLRQKVAIELGTKVVDSEQKLKNTLAHELCHVATWMIDHQKDEKHGPCFKAWAKKIHKAMPDIVVTTTHRYSITYKFNWVCDRSGCSKTYGRHSNSIKPDRHTCRCGGGLVPVPRNKTGGIAKAESTSSNQDPLSEIMLGLNVN